MFKKSKVFNVVSVFITMISMIQGCPCFIPGYGFMFSMCPVFSMFHNICDVVNVLNIVKVYNVFNVAHVSNVSNVFNVFMFLFSFFRSSMF